MQDFGPHHDDLAGQCPRCFRFGVVGAPCGRHGCVESEMHFVPAAHVHPDDPTHDGLIGRIIDRYLLVGVVGHGGFGRVYRALELPLGMRVALKVANLEGASPEETSMLLARFELEASALAALNHPNIVRLLRYGTFGARPYLVMELVPGDRTLERLLIELAQKPRALSRRDLGLILFPLLDALGAAHAQGLIHRDVKPENIMLQPMPSGPPLLRLLDFGLARSLTASHARSRPMGTPLYMAPEQLTNGPLGPWTDLYAVGVIACELFFGARPFSGATERIWGKKLDPQHDPLTDLPPAPPEIALFLRRALALDTATRFRDTEQMRAALAQALAAWPGEEQAGRSAGPSREVALDSRGRLVRRAPAVDEAIDALAEPPAATPTPTPTPTPTRKTAGNATREARPGARTVAGGVRPRPLPTVSSEALEPARAVPTGADAAVDGPPEAAQPQQADDARRVAATTLGSAHEDDAPVAPVDDEEAWFARGDAGEVVTALDDEDDLGWFTRKGASEDREGSWIGRERLDAEHGAPRSSGPDAPSAVADDDAPDEASAPSGAPETPDDEPSWRPPRARRGAAVSVVALAALALLFAFGPWRAEAPARADGRALAAVSLPAPAPAVFEARAALARAARSALIGRASSCTAAPNELLALAAQCNGDAGCRLVDAQAQLVRRSRVALPEPLEPGQSIVVVMRAPGDAKACGARYRRSAAWVGGALDVLPAGIGAYTQPQVVLDVRGGARQRVVLAERATSPDQAERVRGLLAAGVATCLRAEEIGPGVSALELQTYEDVRFYDRDQGFTDERGLSPCGLDLLQLLVVSPAAS